MKKLSHERCMELLNSIIDYISTDRTTGRTVEKLLSMGFQTDELMDVFGFGRDDVVKTEEDESLIPPLTFRLYQSIRFNRPVDIDKDYISPGGYELKMMDEDGTEKSVQFDFEGSEANVDRDDPTVVHYMQETPDVDSFEGLDEVTEHMLRHVTGMVDWFIYTEGPGGNELIPVEILEPTFELISDSTDRDIPIVKIPIGHDIDMGADGMSPRFKEQV